MIKRTSKVDYLKVDSVHSASALQIGDSHVIHNVTRALAVQKEKELFFGNEGNYQSFSIFNRSVPLTPIFEPITIHSTSLNPVIKVGTIGVVTASSAAVLHIGSSEYIQAESRIKHIRQMESIKNQ